MRSAHILAGVAALLFSGITAHGVEHKRTDVEYPDTEESGYPEVTVPGEGEGYPEEEEEHGYPGTPEEGDYPEETEEGDYTEEPEEGDSPEVPDEGDYPEVPEEGDYSEEPEDGEYCDEEPGYPEPTESDGSYPEPTETGEYPEPTESDGSYPEPTETGEYPEPTETPGPCVGGVTGWDGQNPAAYYADDSGDYVSQESCLELCEEHSCVAYAFGETKCLLYSAPVTGNFVSDDESPYTFYDYCAEGPGYPEPTESDGGYPEPTETGEYPEPTETGEYPEPTETGEYPEPTEGGEYPEPTEGGEYPEPTETGEYPEPTEGGEYPEPTEGGEYPEPTEGGEYPEPTEGGEYPHPSETPSDGGHPGPSSTVHPGEPTITPAPSSSAPHGLPPTVTSWTTIVTYTNICPTGYTTLTTTMTVTSTVCNSCPHPTPAPEGPGHNPDTPGSGDLPPGFTTTVTVCTVCGPEPTTVTLTLPAETITKIVTYPTGAGSPPAPPAGESHPAGGNPPAPSGGDVPGAPVEPTKITSIQTVVVTPVPSTGVPVLPTNTYGTPTPSPPAFTGAAAKVALSGMAVVAAGVVALL